MAEGARPDEAVIQIAVHAFDDPDPPTRYLAAWGLGQRGWAATPALPALEQALTDEHGSVREAAAEAIAAIFRALDAQPDPNE